MAGVSSVKADVVPCDCLPAPRIIVGLEDLVTLYVTDFQDTALNVGVHKVEAVLVIVVGDEKDSLVQIDEATNVTVFLTLFIFMEVDAAVGLPSFVIWAIVVSGTSRMVIVL